MVMANSERISRALELLRDGLGPNLASAWEGFFGPDWLDAVNQKLRRPSREPSAGDVAFLLNGVIATWNELLGHAFPAAVRSLVFEVAEVRNRWAHQENLSSDDTIRALDSMERVLDAFGNTDERVEIRSLRRGLWRQVVEEEARARHRTAAARPTSGEPQAGLTPWREIITPHADVAAGRFEQAEFAADLYEVLEGNAEAEYQEPREFFARTYITDGLGDLLVGAARRLSGGGGDPVIELQTNFGGGKTHSMIALYHLASGTPAHDLPGVGDLLREADVTLPTEVRRAVLVGHVISPATPERTDDGLELHTLWGRLAYQLGGRDGYEMVRADDEAGTNPGAALRSLFERFGPAVILIDEWVAYARQLPDGDGSGGVRKGVGGVGGGAGRDGSGHGSGSVSGGDGNGGAGGVGGAGRGSGSGGGDGRGGNGRRRLASGDDWRGSDGRGRLAGGDFDTQFTFAQALTEAAASVPNVVVLVTIPASDIEVGGNRGRTALERLRNVVTRTAAQWQPATPDESFEIVRRRLFDPIPPDRAPVRDAVIRAFSEMYRQRAADFPSGVGEADYRRRMERSYPIHPELFDRLFGDWSALDKFQRTRGVLRLMALAISQLWQRDDRSLLIMPSNLPMDSGPLVSEMKKYLEEGWDPVIKSDVDGPNSLPLRLDGESPHFGRLSATRRVARTVYMASAPRLDDGRGVGRKTIVLGCVQPGEPSGLFADALRHLSGEATHLYVDGNQYWYSLQPNVIRLASERAAGNYGKRDADDEARRRLAAQRDRGNFAAVQVFAEGPGDVPDNDDGVWLVVLTPAVTHPVGARQSPATELAQQILAQREAGPRLNRNMLVFVAATANRLSELRGAARLYLAWCSILDDAGRLALDLTAHQERQARTMRDDTSKQVDALIGETFSQVLIPMQEPATPEVTWQATRVAGDGDIAARAGRKLEAGEELIAALGGARVRMDIDRYNLWSHRGDISVRSLWETYARFLYMPRLCSFEVLAAAIGDGVANPNWAQDTFAYAEAHDGDRWSGLQAGERVAVQPGGLVVFPDFAQAQLSQPPEPPEPDAAGAAAGAGAGAGAGTARAGTGAGAGGDGRGKRPPLVGVHDPDSPPGPDDPSRRDPRGPGDSPGGRDGARTPDDPPTSARPQPTKFYAHFELNPVRAIKQLGAILENVVARLGPEVELSLEIRSELPGAESRPRGPTGPLGPSGTTPPPGPAGPTGRARPKGDGSENPGGYDEATQRTVSENAKTLGAESFEFE